MGVTVCMPLFGNPGHELDEGAALKGRQLRDFAQELHDRLLQAADAIDRLTAAGWDTRVAMFDLLLLHPGVQTRADAEQRLRAVGVDPAGLLIVEDVEEDEEGP